MPVSLPSSRLHTDAVIAALEGASLLVGDAIRPDGAGWADEPGQSVFTPYVIVYRLLGRYDGTITAPDDDAYFEYQLTVVGETREQTEGVTDAALAALIGQEITTSGRRGLRCSVTDTGSLRRDDAVQGPALFVCTPRLAVSTTPGS